LALGEHPLAGFESTDLFENETTIVGFVDGGERILVAAAGAHLLDLAARLGRGSRRIAAAKREEILGRLLKLRQVPLTLAPEIISEAGPSETCPRLLLTPSEQGLSVGIRVRPGPGIVHLRPGEGRERLPVLEDGRFRVASRQLDAERRAALDLAARLGLGDSRSWDWLLAGDDAFDLIRTAQEEAVRGLVVEWPEGDRQRVRGRLLPSDLRVRIAGRAWFAVRGGVRIGEQELSLAELLAALKSGRRYVPLEDGSWVEITAELRCCLETLDDAVRPRRGALEVDPTAVALVLQLLETSEVSCEVTARFRELMDRLREARRLDPVPPAELTATLRGYQLEGYRWLRRLAAWEMAGCLADDMGLGKTVQALALLLDRRNRGPALVVAPTSVGFNWERETRRFAPALTAIAYHGPGRGRLLEGLGRGDLVITSYTLLRRDASRLADVEWGTLVLDEAQAIKNSQTKTAQAARR
ncbi:MAG: hypothetical protein GY856_05600, partial [bacterium]|nr:hypothetical protein [bacterium]